MAYLHEIRGNHEVYKENWSSALRTTDSILNEASQSLFSSNAYFNNLDHLNKKHFNRQCATLPLTNLKSTVERRTTPSYLAIDVGTMY